MSDDTREETRRWDEFIGWAWRFVEWPDFDKEERDYKLVVAARLQAVRKALDGDDRMWPELMHQVMQPPNNLLDWRVMDAFPKWCDEHPEEARQVLQHLWDETTAASVSDRVNRFKKEAAHEATGGQGAIVGSFLLMALDPTTHPIYRNKPYEAAARLTGYPPRPEHSSGAIYQYALDFLDRIIEEARRLGLPIRDRLDAQSLLWSVVRWPVGSPPVSEWPPEEREQLQAYREGTGHEAQDGVHSTSGFGNKQAVWLFQYEPDAYDLVRYVGEHGPIDWWKANQGSAAMGLGQRVYFLRTGGDQAAIVAIGRIVSPVYPAPPDANHRLRVNVLYEAQVEPPLLRGPDLRSDGVLRGYYPLRQGQSGTNFRLPTDVVRRLEEVVRDRLRPFPDVEPDLGTPPVPADLDARTRVIAEVVRRWGQSEFRQQVLDAYERRCAVTGCDAVEALEAAHIAPYRGPHSNSVTNGLPLRADIHALFDLGLLAIDTDVMTVLLAPSLAGTTYASLAGQPLRLPADVAHFPDRAALDEHRRGSGL